MNVLVLSVGTRCKLIQYFKDKVNGFNRVVATDCSKYAPGLYMADQYYIVPPMVEPGYISIIKEISEREKIKVIVPLQETELELLEENRDTFEKMGILVLTSEIETLRTCRDKVKMYQTLYKANIPCIETYDCETQADEIMKLKLPLFAKQRKGAGSIGIMQVDNYKLLRALLDNKKEQLIMQPYLQAEEYGVDVYVDVISGEIISIFIKRKIRMRAGETEKAVSLKNENISNLVRKVVDIMKFRGPIDLDIFEFCGQYYILEINPRFGGGYPHAYACGENYIRYIANNAMKRKNVPKIEKYTEKQVMLKYTEMILIDEEDMF